MVCMYKLYCWHSNCDAQKRGQLQGLSSSQEFVLWPLELCCSDWLMMCQLYDTEQDSAIAYLLVLRKKSLCNSTVCKAGILTSLTSGLVQKLHTSHCLLVECSQTAAVGPSARCGFVSTPRTAVVQSPAAASIACSLCRCSKHHVLQPAVRQPSLIQSQMTLLMIMLLWLAAF